MSFVSLEWMNRIEGAQKSQGSNYDDRYGSLIFTVLCDKIGQSRVLPSMEVDKDIYKAHYNSICNPA